MCMRERGVLKEGLKQMQKVLFHLLVERAGGDTVKEEL